MALNDGSKRIGGSNGGGLQGGFDPFAANDEGFRLLHSGRVEEGLQLLQASSLAGVPWALATYSWHCVNNREEVRAIELAQEALPACQAFVVRESANPELAETAAYQLSNARSNLALCHLAAGGDAAYAMDVWRAGREVGHAESAFYPAILAWRAGNEVEADRIVQALPAPVRAGLRDDMDEGVGCSSDWFAAWCADGLVLLDRAPDEALTAEVVNVERVRTLPRVQDPGVLTDADWDALRLVHGDDPQATERALRSLIDQGTNAAHPARMELGVFLLDDADVFSNRYREGWNLLTRSLNAPFRDVVGATAWNIAAEYFRRGDDALAEGFGRVARELDDPTALKHYAAQAEREGNDAEAQELYERISQEVPPEDPAAVEARTQLARQAARSLPVHVSDWFLSAQGSLPAHALAESAPVYLCKGHYNVDVANAAIATRFFESCECSYEDVVEVCELCGRGPGNFQSTASGPGDGGYAVFQLLPSGEDQATAGAITFFSQVNFPGVGATTTFSATLNSAAPMILGTLDCQGLLIFSDASTCFDSRDVSISIDQPAGPCLVVCWVGVEAPGANFLPVAMAALSGQMADTARARVPHLSDSDRAAIVASLWGDPNRLVNALFVDIRPDVALGNFNMLQNAEDEGALGYLAQVGELLDMESADPELVRDVRDALGCGSIEVLMALETRGYLEPDLPWWQERMRGDFRDAWGRVVTARDPYREIHDVELQDITWVRRALARSPRLTASQCATLAGDVDARVRLNIARNPVSPAAIVESLERDADPAVRAAAADSGDEAATPQGVVSQPSPVPGLSPRFCGMCGTPLAPQANFCGNCGAPVAALAVGQPTAGPGADPRILAAINGDPVARSTVIETVDLTAMRSCFEAAMAIDDLEEAEFWGLELATAPAPATPSDQVEGIRLLCEQVLVPQRRYEEAALYCSWILTLFDPGLRDEGRRIMETVDAARIDARLPRLEHHGEWRFVDLSLPADPGLSQRDHYLRVIAYLRHLDETGQFNEAETIRRDNFMSWLTGFYMGFANEVAEVGAFRETVAKAMADWLQLG